METKDNKLVRDGITTPTVKGRDSIERDRAGREETNIQKPADKHIQRWQVHSDNPTHKDMKALPHEQRQPDAKIYRGIRCQHYRQQNKATRRPAGNVSNWHHLFFLTPLIYSQHWQCESKLKEHSAASALYCMHNAKIKKGAGSKADITTHAFMLPDDVSLPHQREPQLLQKGTRGQNKRRPPRFINSQSINMQSVAR